MIDIPPDTAGGSAPRGPEPSALTVLCQAVADPDGRGRIRAIGRWLDRELDPGGAPLRLPVPDWASALELLGEARRRQPDDWPERFDARIEGFFRGVLRFSRPDGTAVFGPPGPAPEGRRGALRDWAGRLSDPGLATVVGWWFPARGPSAEGDHAPPPLPAWSRPDRPLAVLRANWSKGGDLLAIDHRAPGASGAVELVGLGQTWLGPTWTSCPSDARPPATRAKPTFWLSSPSADVVEWAFRVGDVRLVRTAVLLRGRGLALLAEQAEGRVNTPALRLGLAEGVETRPINDSRGMTLATGRNRPSARVFPIGLPRLPYPSERGSFVTEGRELVLRQAGAGRRCWLPLIVSWEPSRNRLPAHWRTLTVSEKSRPCAPDTAFAARLSWGRDETVLIYRSLARPALRAVLGHQTRARFLIGLFDRQGHVEPLLTVAG